MTKLGKMDEIRFVTPLLRMFHNTIHRVRSAVAHCFSSTINTSLIFGIKPRQKNIDSLGRFRKLEFDTYTRRLRKHWMIQDITKGKQRVLRANLCRGCPPSECSSERGFDDMGNVSSSHIIDELPECGTIGEYTFTTYRCSNRSS